MSAWLGLLLFVVSPLLGGVLWLLARVEYPGTAVRFGVFLIAWLIGLEMLQLVAEPFVRFAFSKEIRPESLPVAVFNWLVLVLPVVVIDFFSIRLARRVASIPTEIEPTVLEASRLDADRRQLCALALGKVVAMAATLGSALGLLAVGVSAALPYLMVYGRGRHSELLWWLALTIRNRLDPAEELLSFAESRRGTIRQRIIDAARDVQRGTDLLDALIIHRLLSPGEIVELRVARATGSLEQGFVACARRCSSEGAASTAVSTNGTIVWLWMMLAGIFAVLSFLSYSILPKYKAIFSDFGMELPQMTLRLSRFSVDGMEMVALLLSLCVLTGWMIIGSIVLTVGWQELQWPWLQQFFPRRDAPGMLRLLGYPIRAGWPAPQSIHLLADEVLRDDLRERLNRVGTQIDAGLGLGQALLQEGYLRPVDAEAVAAGERAGPGRLSFALKALADSLERTRSFRFHRLVETLKPIFLIGLAWFVAFAVIAMFLPVARLIESLS